MHAIIYASLEAVCKGTSSAPIYNKGEEDCLFDRTDRKAQEMEVRA